MVFRFGFGLLCRPLWDDNVIRDAGDVATLTHGGRIEESACPFSFNLIYALDGIAFLVQSHFHSQQRYIIKI